LEPPDLDNNPHFEKLMEQVDWIAEREGRVEGFVNWQGVLNNAHRLRGEALFMDMLEEPEKARHLFACVAETMAAGILRLYTRQRQNGPDHRFVTVSNCLVNMISPTLYRELLLPFDRKLAGVYGCIGVHNCAWDASPYLEAYAELPGVKYIDMGIGSDLLRARALFPHARRALMYTPMDLAQKPFEVVSAEIARAVRAYAPCDIVFADIEAGIADEKVRRVMDNCQALNEIVVKKQETR